MNEKMTIDQAVENFIRVSQEKYPNTHLKNFYCGITNDVDRRINEHFAECLYYVVADSKEIACRLEEALAVAGFDVGEKAANGGGDDSVYVYMYHKTIYTRP